MRTPNPPRLDPVDRVVVEPHSVMLPHQEAYARILIENAKENKKKLKNPKVKCDIYGCKHKLTLVTDGLVCPDCEKRCASRSGLTLHRKSCKGNLVVRALSREFHVNTRSDPLTSRVVLAEVKLSDYPDVKSAEEAVRKMAQPDHVLFKDKGLDVLNRIKRPMEHGYSEDEVTAAAMPYIMKHASMYANHNCEVEDAIQQGWVGIRNTLLSDRAIAPFGSHAFLHIRTNIRRYVTQSGMIRHGERDHDFYGTKGGSQGYKRDDDGNFVWRCPKCYHEWGSKKKIKCSLCGSEDSQKVQLYGTLTSADAEISDGFSVRDAMASQDAGPLEIVMEKDVREHKRRILDIIIEAAGLSEQQAVHIDSLFGFNGEKQLSGTELAKKLGNSRQRVGQQRKKCIEKLRSAAEDLGFDWDLIDE